MLSVGMAFIYFDFCKQPRHIILPRRGNKLLVHILNLGRLFILSPVCQVDVAG